MASAFGFSTGDFIAGINLVKNLIKALNDSRGSSKEYLEVIRELQGLEVTLLLVKSQDENTITQVNQRNALRVAVRNCEDCIDTFLSSLQKYHRHLCIGGSTNKWRDAVHKIQWHICKADDLNSFRLQIASHVQNLEMLLATIQT
jgi:CRISPR/Cas system CMR-associated protein Cmr5 small subunit